MPRRRKPKVFTIAASRWFDRTYGNTYTSVRVHADGTFVGGEMQYGYGDYYLQMAADLLEKAGYMPGRKQYEHGGGETLWKYCDRMGIVVVKSVADVSRKRDLL